MFAGVCASNVYACSYSLLDVVLTAALLCNILSPILERHSLVLTFCVSGQ